VECKPASLPIWPGTWTEKAAKMIRKDLEAARSAWIAEVADDEAEREDREASLFLMYSDDEGCVADFHSLRHTFVTMLVQSGVAPKLAQSLARHSSITLTMDRYAHVGLYDRSAALERIPSILPQDRGGNASVGVLRATGTDEKAVNLPPHGDTRSHFACTEIVDSVDETTTRMIENETITLPTTQSETCYKTGEMIASDSGCEGMKQLRALGLEPRTYGLKVRCSTD
jgi:hypothetical protein